MLVILVEAFSKTTQAAANPTQAAANPTNRLAVRNVTWMSLFIPCSGVKFSLLLNVAKRSVEYRIVGNFRELQIFTIFATHNQYVTIRTVKYETAKM